MTMEDFYVEFGRALKQLRTNAHLTQDELATRVGLGRTSVTNIEQGRQHVPLHMLFELASAVGVEPVALLPKKQAEAPLSEAVQTALGQLAGREEQEWLRQLVATPDAIPR